MSPRVDDYFGSDAASWTLDRTVAVVAAYLPVSLVSPESLQRVISLTRQLPAALSQFVYIECRLTASDPQVDVILNITDAGRRIIAGQNPVIALPERLRAHPLWQRVIEFCRRWTDPRSPLHDTVRSIWLEFDLDERCSDVPVPGIFVRLEGGIDQTTSVPEPEKVLLVCNAILPVLLGRELESSMHEHVRRCIDSLPAGARLSEIGALLPRADHWIRLCIKDVPEPLLLPYLSSVGWGGHSNELQSILERFSKAEVPGHRGAMHPGYLDLDVGDVVEARLGLEYFMERGPRQLVHGVSESAWLDKLVDARVCARDKRDGLLAWPGYFHARFAHEVWPSVVVRHANHVKLVYAPGQPLIAKAYLYFLHQHYKRTDGGENPWMRSSLGASTNQP